MLLHAFSSRRHATMMTEGTQLKVHLYMLARVAIGVSINQSGLGTGLGLLVDDM